MKRSRANIIPMEMIANVLGVHRNTVSVMISDGRLSGNTHVDLRNFLEHESYERGIKEGKGQVLKEIEKYIGGLYEK